MKRPRRVQLPATKTSPASGHQLSDQEEADHGQGYEGDSSSGSGRSWGERSRRSRAGRRGRVGSHGRRSSGGGSEANGLDLVSGYKRLPKQDVLMRPLKSVLVKRRNSEGEADWAASRKQKKVRLGVWSGVECLSPLPRIPQWRNWGRGQGGEHLPRLEAEAGGLQITSKPA